MDHVFLLIYPLMVGYSAHALVYAKHASFYSWGLSSSVGFVYAFGFVMMTPQARHHGQRRGFRQQAIYGSLSKFLLSRALSLSLSLS
jgi:hypothetical protein